MVSNRGGEGGSWQSTSVQTFPVRQVSKQSKIYLIEDNLINLRSKIYLQTEYAANIVCLCHPLLLRLFLQWSVSVHCAGIGTVSFLSVSTVFTYKAAKCWYQRPHYTPTPHYVRRLM